MRHDKLRWIAVLAAMAAGPAWLMVSGEPDAAAQGKAAGKPPVAPAVKEKPAPAKDGGADAAPATVTISGVSPSSGTASDSQIVTITGTHFGADTKVFFGPTAIGELGACQPVELFSETLLQCKLPAGLQTGFALSFRAGVKGEKGTLSEASKATYTPLESAGPTRCVLAGPGDAGSPPYTQVHLGGADFAVEGGGAPLVFYQEQAGAPRYACRHVVLVGPRELFCYLPGQLDAEKVCKDAKPVGQFTVVRPGDAP